VFFCILATDEQMDSTDALSCCRDWQLNKKAIKLWKRRSIIWWYYTHTHIMCDGNVTVYKTRELKTAVVIRCPA